MTIQQLKNFLQIAKASPVPGRAAGSIPPFQLRLRLLEEELHSPLFTSSRELTPAGRLLKGRAEAILSQLDQLAEDVHMEGISDTLRVGAIPSISGRKLPRVAAGFRRDFPNVHLHIQEAGAGELLRLLRSGHLDLCLVREPFDSAGLQSLPVQDGALRPGEEDYFAAAALPCFFSSRGESAPLSLKDLWGKPLLVPRCYRELLHSACLRQGFEPRTICESESPHTALLWAAGGLGIAVLPYTAAVLSTDARLLIRRLDTGLPSPRVCLVQQPDAALTDEVRAFIRLIQA
ncbi:MAG: LysR family transcriptional regulator [Oscillibacter sp.]|nr:LysR family transcriptional regulator [Oscillibacter sp.]